MSVALEPATSHDCRGLVQVTLQGAPYAGRAEAVIAGLLGDMRMLGLQPAIVARG